MKSENTVEEKFMGALSEMIAPHFENDPPLITGYVVCVEVMEAKTGKVYGFHIGDTNNPYWRHLGLLMDAQDDVLKQKETPNA